MSEKQFEVIMAAIQSLKGDMNTRIDAIDTELVDIKGGLVDIKGELVRVNGELKRIEVHTPYNANQDTMANLAAINGH
jgi:hypothetical protein